MVIITVADSVELGGKLTVTISNPDKDVTVLSIQTWIQNREGRLSPYALSHRGIRIDPNEKRTLEFDIPEDLSNFPDIVAEYAEIELTVSDTRLSHNTVRPDRYKITIPELEEK